MMWAALGCSTLASLGIAMDDPSKDSLATALNSPESIVADINIVREADGRKSDQKRKLDALDFPSQTEAIAEESAEKRLRSTEEISVEELIEQAQAGDREAQYRLGTVYHKGKMKLDSDAAKEAIRWFTKAADQGHAKALYELGGYYYSGESLEYDAEKGFKLIEKAAQKNYVVAQITLGDYYLLGGSDYVDIDLKKAVFWYKKAAAQGDCDAQFKLAECYTKGTGTRKNKNQAFQLYREAAEQGHLEAQYTVGRCYAEGRGVAKDLNQAFAWFKKAALSGSEEARYKVGCCYRDGYGVNKDVIEAVRHFLPADEYGNLITSHYVGHYIGFPALREVLGPLKKLTGPSETFFEKWMQDLKQLIAKLIKDNDIKADSPMPHFWQGRIENPELLDLHQALSDFGIALFSLLDAVNLPGFMVNFATVPFEFDYKPNHKSDFLKAYLSPFSYNGYLTCFGKEAVAKGDLLHQLMEQQDEQDSISYTQVYDLIQKRIEIETMSEKDTQVNTTILDTLIRSIGELRGSGQETYHQEMLKEAQSYGISAEDIMPLENSPINPISYLKKKVHYEELSQEQRSYLVFLKEQMTMLKQIKDGLFNYLWKSVHLRNQRLLQVYPRLAND
ncbi:tetratricopeptide repeat protein [Candidatus Odyssella thessalonicensis]|uniref:tetratricopeptide repeat protein n=1 Tax=Candidatus Odyssella thessalonicensis TaxID=84647 RepID=UPI000311DABD|nr:tetratricopeptide repeat protein [Candidatus Odyssella thessalonicensis]